MKIINLLESFIDLTGRIVSWLTLFMVLTTFIVVILRYVFDIGWIALQESITYMHAAVFLVGAAYTLQKEAHVRVDILYCKLSVKARAVIDLLGTIFLLVPMMAFITWISWEYILDSWSVLEGSREASGLPGVYLLKSLILVMSILLLFQAITMSARALYVIMDRN